MESHLYTKIKSKKVIMTYLDSQICEKITKILSIQYPEIYQRLEDSVPGGSGRGNSLFNSYLHFVNNHI